MEILPQLPVSFAIIIQLFSDLLQTIFSITAAAHLATKKCLGWSTWWPHYSFLATPIEMFGSSLPSGQEVYSITTDQSRYPSICTMKYNHSHIHNLFCAYLAQRCPWKFLEDYQEESSHLTAAIPFLPWYLICCSKVWEGVRHVN